MCSVHTVQAVNNLSPLYLYLISGMKPNLPTVVNHEGGHENKYFLLPSSLIPFTVGLSCCLKVQNSVLSGARARAGGWLIYEAAMGRID